tara:strand:+ start:1625 stop:2407 length:783 start_codon:yes stop_codon:yes gene_type:complete
MTFLRKIIWFLLRPQYYYQFFSLFIKKINLYFIKNQDNAILTWCQDNALSTSEALYKITNKSKFNILRDEYPELYKIADEKVTKCPVKMGGSANTDFLYNLCEFLKAKNVVETGVAYGWSSLSLLLSLKNREDSLLISTDMPYPGLNNEQYVGVVISDELKDKWKLIPMEDKKSLPLALDSFEEIDLCHYDSDKYYEGRMWAYPLMWEKLREGGILISDDIEDNSAFKDFSKKINKKPIVVEFNNKNKKIGFQYVGVLIK